MGYKSDFLNYFRRPLATPRIDGLLADLIELFPNSTLLRRVAPGPPLYASGSTRSIRRYGINFEIDVSDYPGWSLFYYSTADSSRGVLEFANEADVVLDIGGNIGQTALMLAKKVGEAGKVISFEPFPNSISRFEKNLALNPDVANVSLQKFGLGSKEQDVRMIEEGANNSAGNRIVANDAAVSAQVIEIKVRVLDDFVRDLAPERIDLIKIDVEGYEMRVLEGAEKTLVKFRPKLFIEVSDQALQNQNSSASEVISFLAHLGYRFRDMSTSRSITSASQLGSHTDLYCEFTLQ